MADFYQHAEVTTFHRLGNRSVGSLEAELSLFRDTQPMALVLPSLYSELQGPALARIVDELVHVPYLEQIIVGLDRADEAQYQHALSFFERLPQRPDVLWHDGPRLQRIHRLLEAHDLAPSAPGKGRNVWYMFGYLLATGRAKVVALHDCNILTYERGMLARLLYPVAHPGLGYSFCKGYYARVANDRINGRICRLLVTPLLRALKKVCGADDYLDFLDGFRYPLAGEVSVTREVIENVHMPSDWGLEMSILSEMHRNQATSQICQVDIADTYNQMHQEMSSDERLASLNRMARDIVLSLFRKMATNGQVFGKARIRTIKATYYRLALDQVNRFDDLAVINGMRYDRHREVQAVELFAENILSAGREFLDLSMEPPFLPSWRRVQSAIPDIYEQLIDAVATDRRELGDGGSSAVSRPPKTQHLRQRVDLHLTELYGAEQAKHLADKVLDASGLHGHAPMRARQVERWDSESVFVITYGDSIRTAGETPLSTLYRFLKRELDDVVTGVHILPFFPYSSDDGFSVIDYETVNPELGTWTDIKRISSTYTLMADVVLNHCSSESVWFDNYRKGISPGAGWFIEVSDDADLSQVVRPRSSPVTTSVETINGEKQVWCTFSADQVDLDFSNPEVLLAFVGLLRDYVNYGIRYFRLDAVAFLWKQSGTTCIHLPQTHEAIKLIRLLLDEMHHKNVVITETNVPVRENLSYFGNGNEAHLVYNFSLPPLLVNTMLTGSCQHLTRWAMYMPPALRGRAYLNFIASHDGIGVRPTEGLLDEAELTAMLDTLCSFGGHVSTRRNADGRDTPYEVNISLFDAMAGTIEGGKDQHRVARFLCAHTIMLALEGVPAIYLHSLLATPNAHDLVAETGRARSINRRQWDEADLEAALADPELPHRVVLDALLHLIRVRKAQPAFHPNATQYTLHFGDAVFAFWRESLDRDQNIFALHNITDRAQQIGLAELNLIGTDSWRDLLTNEAIDHQRSVIDLAPYQCVWISNR
ncbi:MAG: alpha-amylase family glycosyl hydrolase [Myxococcota bacterium]|nr:alpha-amylase family glycosyl hydrolase [Myxococcota bacterium]